MRRMAKKSIIMALASVFAVNANAQVQKPPPLVTPPTQQIQLPAYANPNQPATHALPPLALPPSNPCKATDLPGVWKLENVYESPSGKEAASFAASPSQYIYFEDNNVFGKYNAPAGNMKPEDIRDQIVQHASGLQQYLMQDKEFIFFYQDRVASGTQACFIVETAQSPFAKGQLILMPPKGTVSGRLVKWYSKIWSPPTPPKPAPAAAPAQPQGGRPQPPSPANTR